MDCPSCHTPNIDNARFCAKCGALLPVAQQDADPLIGQVIKNTFRVTRMIGEGGMGRVYEGEQQMGTTTRKVAIKTLHPDLSRDAQILARFNRECGTVAELEHPNTIQFFDFGQTNDGTLFIAMEFLEGPSVAKVLETTGALAPARVEKIMKQIAGSLNEAHKKGIVHRDLKPENIILTHRAGEEDFVKVLDFGIAARREATDAKKEQKLTQQGMVLGTPPYMSPEQFKGQELDARSDIYSLGVMAYEMLTGKLPFDAATPWEWATKHLTERPFPFEVSATASNIPPGMKDAIMRALSKNRDERQADVSQFLVELGGDGGAPRLQAASHPGTAAMAAPPMELLQSAPMATPLAHQPAPTAAGMAVPVQPQYQPSPPQPRPVAKSGPNKGLIFGLVGVLGVLVIVGIIVLAKSLSKGGGTDEGPIALPSAPASVTVEAFDAGPVASIEIIDAGKTPTATTTTTARTAPADAGSSKGPQGEEACTKSRSLAQGGQIEAAVAMYRACQNGGQTAPITHRTIAQNAGPAAQRARFLHDCKKARSIADSATSIGAQGSSQQEAAQCK